MRLHPGLLLLGLIALATPASADEPRIDGRTVDEWVGVMKEGGPESWDSGRWLERLRPDEARALMPTLIRLLQDPGRDERDAARSALFHLAPHAEPAVPALVARLRDREDPDRERYALILGMIEPPATTAIPALLEVLRDPENREFAHRHLVESSLHALARIHPDPAPVIAEWMLGPMGDRWGYLGCEVLAQLGPDAAPAVPALVACLAAAREGGDERAARAGEYEVIETLSRIGPGARAAIPALEAVRDPSHVPLAALALAAIDPGSGQAEAMLRPLLADAEPDAPAPKVARLGAREDPAIERAQNRFYAAWIKARITPDDREALRVVADVIRREGGSDYAVSLASLDPTGEVALPALIASLDGEGRNDLESSIRAISSYGGAARGAVPKLAALLADPERGSQVDAARALRAIGPAAGEAIPALRKAASGGDAELRDVAILALARVDPTAVRVADLLPLLRSSGDPPHELDASIAHDLLIDRLAQGSARFAAGMLGIPGHRPAVRRLGEAVGRHARRSMAAALLARRDAKLYLLPILVRLGPDARPLVPAITRGLDDRPEEMPELTLILLAALGPAADGAIPRLRTLLADDRASDAARDWSALLLARLDPGFEPTLPTPYERLDAAGRQRFRRAAFGRLQNSSPFLFGAFEGFRRQPEGHTALCSLLVGSVGLVEESELLFPEVVIQATRGRTPLDRAVGLWTTARAAPFPSAALPPLIAGLSDRDELARAAACYGLGLLGPGARPAVGPLRARRDDPSEARHVRAWATRALERIEADAPR